MSLFELFGALVALIAFCGYINYRFIRLPETIGITAAGLLFSLALTVVGYYQPGAVGWATALVDKINFSEVVFHGSLGVLLFAGSLHVNIADLAKQRLPIIMLSTAGVVISAWVTGIALYALLCAIGVSVSLIHCLLLGAALAPTDPLAVQGLLATARVSKALKTSIVGESMFNDGTGVVVYLGLLSLLAGSPDLTLGGLAALITKEIGGGIATGLVLGYVGFLMLKGLDSYPVEILVTLALAVGGYALAERLHVSAPLAVVVAGLVIGNHGAKHAMSERTREHLFSFWGLLDEVLNLLLFGLIGLKLLSFADAEAPLAAVVGIIPIILVARLISVSLPLLALSPQVPMPPHAIKVLTWGGLRGGISIALVLSMPDFQGKELFIMATYAVVLFSLLVQAPTLAMLLRRIEKETV